ncbi:hypothetical protein AYM40_33550 [Paraburkholderia phytofirmans OLGA172]|uniref:Uncharacterized protein n=1 Tax=Paraburkholderia phytofirmans OLGA172 TaxID=1417228 RepID=A0A167WJ46_9BURK|nr:hypothetical protein AYM40_33550 [Paraburkholderia phytofirmans OLGA172]
MHDHDDRQTTFILESKDQVDDQSSLASAHRGEETLLRSVDRVSAAKRLLCVDASLRDVVRSSRLATSALENNVTRTPVRPTVSGKQVMLHRDGFVMVP